MLFLIVWMQFADTNVMTVQATPAEMCDSLSETMAAEPTTAHVVCTSSPQKVERYIANGDCVKMDSRDSFTNYACAAPKGWKL